MIYCYLGYKLVEDAKNFTKKSFDLHNSLDDRAEYVRDGLIENMEKI